MKHRRLWQLEALRGFAALYVLLHHTSSSYLNLKTKVWGFPFRFGLEAVLIFFVLSGFVISYAHQDAFGRTEDFRNYFIKRTRRIYPIFILSMLLAYVIQCISAHGWAVLNVPQLAGNLCMVQNLPGHPGTFCLPFADNDPLWSLSFEWWFYMMFYPIDRWVSRSAQKFVVFGICAVGLAANQIYPNSIFRFLAYFIIWWAGVELAHEFRKTGDISLSKQKMMIALIGLPVAWYAVDVWLWVKHGGHLTFHGYPLIDLRYFAGTVVLVGLVLAWRKIRFAGFNRIFGWFLPLGGISYALYVFHFPIICDLRLLGGRKFFYVDLVLRISLAFFLAWLAEGLLQKWINRVTNPLLSRNTKE